MQLALEQHPLKEASSPSLCPGRPLGALEQTLLFTVLRDDPQCPSRVRLEKAARQYRPIAVRIRHLNRWRAGWQRHRRQGRPRAGLMPRACCPSGCGRQGDTPGVVCCQMDTFFRLGWDWSHNTIHPGEVS